MKLKRQPGCQEPHSNDETACEGGFFSCWASKLEHKYELE